jgi:MinD-like ATPase involved in chromosome partitioning or flagellar assembly
MHVVTFYSFKGGVGRSMALVNVAAELARSGRRVLMVDLDLEAPGLRSFRFPRTQPSRPGFVEYVSQYLATDVVPPSCEDYIYETQTFPDTNGSLWLMPAGIQNETYEQRFSAINWEELYSKRDGFLLLENLRSQWHESIRPDYVLIDSRTGFTDVAGICTRQLPDAVCLVFTPNPQNLFGLKQVCNAINLQKAFVGLRQPQVHFVASNVPNLDDENEVLSRTLADFSKELGYSKLTATIHHYSSLALIDQAPFILDHPKSQLSRQYAYLAAQITKNNPEDKKSALNFLQSVAKDYPEGREDLKPKDVELRIEKILACLGQDNDILFWVSRVYRSAGKWAECRVLLEQVISDGYKDQRARLDLARIKIRGATDDQDSVAEDLLDFLNLDEPVKVNDVLLAIGLMLEDKMLDVERIANSHAVSLLSSDDVQFLVTQLYKTTRTSQLSRAILETALLRDELNDEERTDLAGALCLSLISLGELREAVRNMDTVVRDPSTLDMVHAFNFGFALYWDNDQRYEICFSRVLSLAPLDFEDFDLNHLQCLAFASWATGESDAAKNMLSRARALARSQFHAFTFSCWRYLEVMRSDFIHDLDELEELFAGMSILPVFLRNKTSNLLN